MTGTASELYETTANVNSQSNNFRLLSSWLFGRISTGCSLVDVSTGGCRILIPRKHTLINDRFRLVIMSPLDRQQAIMVLSAEKRWQQTDYSDHLVKAGFRFTQVESKDLDNIRRLAEHFRGRNATPVHCNLVNG